ncbi:ABC transporter substrate-binding protein [Carnobacterium viridans]|uniref:Peptide/nickel transport system substrate-binding protein n=1 Tax=Carnobacterium viridans TaxID=174587 RepID=A0A1H1AUL4_9LACT|nr:ABC transporter substrate-binding protein [Carnobacterium viridans]UDE96050.1 ABC transporter substrate-binding protein [Carnobacterium viridans]SDQ43360.1 peptide/nickel transport system substrate-binding protein [Carnobacterium viridans]
MKKRLLSLLTLTAGVVLLAACGVQTEDQASNGNSAASTSETTAKNTIELLGTSSNETDMNIVRDQLIKNGFDVKLNTQPDYASFQTQKEAGNYDLAISSWTTVTGNPDYAVRSLFITDGDNSSMSNSEVDALIDEAALQTADEYTQTYKELEDVLVTENAYIAPLYTSLKAQAFNSELLKPDSIRLSKSRAFAWENVQFNDTALNDTESLLLTQTMGDLTSLDPIKGNDGSINQLNTNMYVRLVNLTDDDKVVSDGSLSYNHAIADGNSDYYFILRDDINFAAVEDGQAVDTGKMVSGQDAIFSLNRAKNPNSVPDHRTYSLHEHIDSASLVTDLAELENAQLSDGSGSVKEALEAGLEAPIAAVVEDAEQVDNASGNYQVIKMTTTEPFPQVLNYLAHQSAGIVSQEQVESINTYDIENFDITTDIPYGDQRTVTKGETYDNHLYASGPYIMIQKDDYAATFQKNPAYMAGTENEAQIANVTVRFIGDADSALSALRSGEIHLLYGLDETKYDVVEGEDSLTLQSMPSNGVTYMLFNTNGRDVSDSADLRKSILYSINQDEISSAYDGLKLKAYSTVSPLVDTGNELVADPAKVEEFYQNYLDSAN